MRALHAYFAGTSPVLEDVVPTMLGHADARFRVAAATVNPVDVVIAAGRAHDVVGLPDLVGIGWDVSGTVTELGGDVTGLDTADASRLYEVVAAGGQRGRCLLIPERGR